MESDYERIRRRYDERLMERDRATQMDLPIAEVARMIKQWNPTGQTRIDRQES